MVSKESPTFTPLSDDATESPRLTALEMPSQQLENIKPVEISSRTGKPKRRKAARACTNCQRTHLTCDDDRPCERCVKRGCASTCVDGERKKTKKPRGSSSSTTAMEASDFAQVMPELLGHHRRSSIDLSHPLVHEHDHIQLIHSPPLQQQPHFSHHPQSGGVLSHVTKYTHERYNNRSLHRLSNDYSHIPSDYSRTDSQPEHGQGDPEHPQPPLGPLNSFDLHPEIFEPMDSYPLPSHPSLNGFTREIGRIGNKDGSVITSMLHERYVDSDNSVKSADMPQFSRYVGSYAGGRRGVAISDGAGYNEDGVLPWLEPPMNPLVNAHDETSRRFPYRYERTSVSEVYRRVTEPHPHRKSFARMVEYLKERLPVSEFKQVAEILTRLKAHFHNAIKSLSPEDNLFVEQSFQRSLLEEEKQFALTAVPCLVWRRSGLIAAVSPRFSKLAQWSPEQLKSNFIVQAMTNESILRYFQKLQTVLVPGNATEFRFECILLTPSGEEIPTEAEVTVRMDIFNVPLTIVGKFWAQQQQ